MTTITVPCPEAMISDANHWAMVLAFGPADAQTYDIANLGVDDAGNRYACTSFEAREEWLTDAQSELTRPAWDTGGIIDMAAAARAQAALVFTPTPIPVTPDRIVAMAGPPALEALASMGITYLGATE